MRIVSQDGMIDIPYDMYVVCIDYRNKKRIMAMSAVGMGEDEMATYSTEAKAIKAMEMLRDVYKTYSALKDGLGSVHNTFVLPKVFQFPKDQDVEVEDE